MRNVKMLAVMAAASATLLAPTVAPAQAATVGTLAGFTQPENEMIGMIGSLCDPPNVCQVIHYNNFFPDPHDGIAPTAVFVNTTTGEQIVVGYSLGGAVITLYTRQNPSLPGEDISFITFGNPFIGQIPGTVSYPVTEVVHEYDQAADLPDDWSNLLAVLNLAASQRHGGYTDADLTTTDARVYVDGNVTYRLIDTYPLPLIAWLDPSITVWLDPVLRPIVDSAYNRDFQQYPEVSSTTTATTTQEVTSWTEPTTLTAVSFTDESPNTAAAESSRLIQPKALSTPKPGNSSSQPKLNKPKKATPSASKPASKPATKTPAARTDTTKPKHEPNQKHEAAAKAPKRGGGHHE